tara:strand:- start:570 stop:881 length:312 start_codon:yes stop_codon:yes gene_type:complete
MYPIMEITILSETSNPLLHRVDVSFLIDHADSTPNRIEVRDNLAARLNKNTDEVIIRKLRTQFGTRKTIGDAKIYENSDFAQSIEQDHIILRNQSDTEETEEE